MATAKLFTLGKAQAVRIPARYRLNAKEVDITQHEGGLLLIPKPRSAADLFTEIRAKYGPIDIERPAQGEARPIDPLNL